MQTHPAFILRHILWAASTFRTHTRARTVTYTNPYAYAHAHARTHTYPQRVRVQQDFELCVPEPRYEYDTCRSGRLRNNFDRVAFLSRHLTLSTGGFSISPGKNSATMGSTEPVITSSTSHCHTHWLAGVGNHTISNYFVFFVGILQQCSLSCEIPTMPILD